MTSNKNRIIRDVTFLSSLRPFRNYENTSSLNVAASYILGEFKKTGLKTSIQEWVARDNQYRNVTASFLPGRRKRLIIGAHYDVHYNQPGADDNASGVAGLLETARIVAFSQPTTSYGIDFIAYSLEEPPFFGTEEMGSFVHARSLSENGTDVLGMICYEMIGHYRGTPHPEQYFPEGVDLNFPDSDKFIGVISIKKYYDFHRLFYTLMKHENDKRAAFVSFPDTSVGPHLSDNRNYWHFGFPALMLNDGPSGRNLNYHKKTDTPDTLDFDIMNEVVSAAANAVMKF